MSEEKEEALRQINEIKNHLVDKQTFFPYNYNATYIWSIIAVILTLGIVPIYTLGTVIGTGIVFVLVAIGFIAEGMMTKKVNRSYDIEDCTFRQQFIMKNFLMMSWYLIVMSAVLVMYNLYIPIYLLWLFMVSLGYYAVGYVLNIKRFSLMGQFNTAMATILLALVAYNGKLIGTDSIWFSVVQGAVLLGLAVLPAVIAWYQKKEA